MKPVVANLSTTTSSRFPPISARCLRSRISRRARRRSVSAGPDGLLLTKRFVETAWEGAVTLIRWSGNHLEMSGFVSLSLTAWATI